MREIAKATAVKFEDVSMRFGTKTVLNNITLDITEGEYVVLLGPSGGGKTTLLNILGGFLRPSDGRVFVSAQDITGLPPAKRPTTTVFQDYALFPHMTIASNVGFGLRMRGIPNPERDKRVKHMLDMVGLGETAARKPHELSGGQRQRIALARALVVEPTVLLLDEPLGALDMKLRRQLQEELKSIQQRVGTTFVHVTHDQEEAMAIADRIVVINQGIIEDNGPPERVYLRPGTLFTAGFMGESNFLDAKLIDHDDTGLTVDTGVGRFKVPLASITDDFRLDAAPEGRFVASIRPEHIVAIPSGEVTGHYAHQGYVNVGDGRIDDVGFFGTHHQCRLTHNALNSFRPIVRMAQSEMVARGDVVSLFVHPKSVVVLPASDAQVT